MAEQQVQNSNAPGGFLGTVERVGNKLPDPAVLFIALLFIVWILSWLLSYVTFDVVLPRTGEVLVIKNLLTGSAFTEFLSVMVTNFSHFHPVGVSQPLQSFCLRRHFAQYQRPILHVVLRAMEDEYNGGPRHP